MKKVLLGLSAVLLIVSSTMGMERASSDPVLSRTSKGEVRPRSKSLPAPLLPKMDSGKVMIKEVFIPKWIASSTEQSGVIKYLKDCSERMAQVGMKDTKELRELTTKLTGNSDIRAQIFELVGEDALSSLGAIQDSVYMRLLENGELDTYWAGGGSFVGPEAEKCAKMIYYDGRPISTEVCLVAGLYISALCFVLNGHAAKRSQPLQGVIEKVASEKRPVTHYLLWAIEKAIADKQLLKIAASGSLI